MLDRAVSGMADDRYSSCCSLHAWKLQHSGVRVTPQKCNCPFVGVQAYMSVGTIAARLFSTHRCWLDKLRISVSTIVPARIGESVE